MAIAKYTTPQYICREDPTVNTNIGHILNTIMSIFLTNFVPAKEKVLLMHMNTKLINTSLIQVYAPTAEKNDKNV